MLLRIFELVDYNGSSKKSKIFNNVIVIIIILNLITIVLESYAGLAEVYAKQFNVFELISIIIFSIEYILRVATSVLMKKEGSNISKIVSYILSPMALIDLFAILPFYIPFIIKTDLRVIRILRIFRIFRVMKLNKYSSSLDLMFRVLKKEKHNLLISSMMVSILIFISATLMYYIESNIQPEHFSSIPATFWWAVNTLTTVGYGDVYPLTTFGKILSGVISILGIGIVAIPTGIISSGFVSELSEIKENKDKDVIN